MYNHVNIYRENKQTCSQYFPRTACIFLTTWQTYGVYKEEVEKLIKVLLEDSKRFREESKKNSLDVNRKNSFIDLTCRLAKKDEKKYGPTSVSGLCSIYKLEVCFVT